MKTSLLSSFFYRSVRGYFPSKSFFACCCLHRGRHSFLRIDRECCHNKSVVAAHVDHVVRFSIFTVLQVSSLDQYVINLFLGPFKRSVRRLLSMRFSALCVECCEVLYHQPLLHPVSSFVPLVGSVRTNTDSLHSISWAQFGVEVSSHNLYALLSGIRVLPECYLHFLYVMVSIPRVVKVHTH